jgi:hypothetical protein
MTISLQLQVHTIRRRGPLDYELLAYFIADQPWAYTDLEAALITYAALPVNHDSLASTAQAADGAEQRVGLTHPHGYSHANWDCIAVDLIRSHKHLNIVLKGRVIIHL